MKRLFLSAAVLPLLHAAPALAQTTISTGTTVPVATSTTGDLTIAAGGSITLSAAGAAVTQNSNNLVTNAGAISFNNVDNATGILVQAASEAGSATPAPSPCPKTTWPPIPTATAISTAPSPAAGRVSASMSPGPTPGRSAMTPVRSSSRATIPSASASRACSPAICRIRAPSRSPATRTAILAGDINGNVSLTGSQVVSGEGAVGVSLGNVTGQVQIQGVVSATGFRYTTRLADDARGKLDADDLKLGGPAVRISGSIGGGLLLDAPPPDTDTTNDDEDGDGLSDAAEGTASVTSFGSAPAIDLGGPAATKYGVVGAGEYGFGVVIRGGVIANGVNDGFGATAIRIGQDGGGVTSLAGGLNVFGGSVTAQAYGSDVVANGGPATAILINPGSIVPEVRNTGTIGAALVGGAQDARAIVDLSGSVNLVENYGLITATSTPKIGTTNVGQTIAVDLRANTSGAIVRQILAAATSTPSIVGDILLGSGNDRVELLGGTLKGALDFGAGNDALVIDNGASAAGRLAAAGALDVNIINGRLAISNVTSLNLTSLNMGAKGVLAVAIDPVNNTATHFNVAGAANIASGAQFDLTLSSILRGTASYEIVKAGSLTIGDANATLAGSPYLYVANLTSNAQAGTIGVNLRPKTLGELGLTGSSAQAFPAVFASLDKDAAIENAFLTADTKEAFTGLYSQMLPDHSGAALMSAQTISSAISQAVARPAIKDVSDDGGMWAQEIVFRIDHAAEQAMGFRSQGFGLASGIETVGVMNALGLSASFVTTDYHDKGAASGEQVAMNFFEGGAYWRFEAGGLKADVRGGLGYVHFDSNRLLVDPAASLDLKAKAKWGGWLGDAHAGLSYEVKAGRFYARPELSADYLRMSEGKYQEAGGGDGFDLSVDSRKGDLMTGQALLALGARFGDEFYWSPGGEGRLPRQAGGRSGFDHGAVRRRLGLHPRPRGRRRGRHGGPRRVQGRHRVRAVRPRRRRRLRRRLQRVRRPRDAALQVLIFPESFSSDETSTPKPRFPICGGRRRGLAGDQCEVQSAWPDGPLRLRDRARDHDLRWQRRRGHVEGHRRPAAG
jgi:hypothetical protein